MHYIYLQFQRILQTELINMIIHTVHTTQRLSIRFILYLSPEIYFILYMWVKYICSPRVLKYDGGLNFYHDKIATNIYLE